MLRAAVAITLTAAVGIDTATILQWNDRTSSWPTATPSSSARRTRTAASRSRTTSSSITARRTSTSPAKFTSAAAPATSTTTAQLTGNVSGSRSADLLKTGNGVLELIGQNNYLGNTLVHEGTLVVGSGGSIGTAGGNRTGERHREPGRGPGRNGQHLHGRQPVGDRQSRRGDPRRESRDQLARRAHRHALLSADLTIHSTATDRGTIQFEFDRTAPNAATASTIALAGGFNLNLEPGTGNQFALELVDTGVGDPPVLGETYTVTLATVGPADQIRLNGVDLPDGVIAQSNYVLQSSSFTIDPAHSLFVETDGSGKHLRLSFAITPVPEPATALAIARCA